MKVGDLVRACYSPSYGASPWYTEMLEKGDMAIVVGVHETHAGQCWLEVHYQGAKQVVMQENVELVNEDR